VYLSTDAGQPLTAVLERSTYVPALNDASCNGCDDFLGSARERLFSFTNGQTGVNNPQAQGLQHNAKDGLVSENAVQTNTAFINALRYGINCAVIGYTATAPTSPGPPNLPGSQFPPR
jgi:hypothetical protein